MKHNYYIVTFRNEKTVFVSCFNETEAKILAQAVMIRKGLAMEVESIVKTTNISDMTDVDFIVWLELIRCKNQN